MGRVTTNMVSLAYAREASLGLLPGETTAGDGNSTADFRYLEPNDIGDFGANITLAERTPIDPDRQRNEPIPVDLDSSAGWPCDATISAVRDFAEGLVFATGVNTDVSHLAASAAANTDGEYTLSSALVASQIGRFVTDAAGSTLVWVSGFATAANNGLKEIDVDATASTTLSVADTLTDESGASARISFAGHRVADGESVTWTWSSSAKQATLSVTGLGTILASLGLTAGQLVHIGSVAAVGGAIQNAFDDGGTNDAYGYAYVVSVSANAIVFENVDSALQTSLSDSGILDIVFGEYLRNVPTTHADFLEASYCIEQTLPNLGTGAVGNTDTSYRYSRGNRVNTLSLNLPLAEKATLNFGLIGIDTDDPTTTRRAASTSNPAHTKALSSSADVARLRIQDVDESGLSTDFKNMSITINNGVTPEKVIGQLGARYMNTGIFKVDVDATMLFTNPLVVNRMRAGTRVNLDFVLSNDDGVVALRIPSMTLGGGGNEYPVGESVRITSQGQAYKDPTLNTSIGISILPVPIPTAA